ncbi:imm11 family protein [uncultured Sphingomonas sp.]|uniref:imm11 family protein n=1 Tax=uncultured Sphingomonas sp. TaxID=158754 RepID=UPI0035C9810C
MTGMPVPLLRLTHPDFAPNLLHWGIQYVSAELRDALALGPDVVEYLPVDSSRSSAAACARDYMVMNVLNTRELIDLNRVAHERVMLPVEFGRPEMRETVIRKPEQRIYWREDFVPDVPLFHAAHSPWIIATDAFAERVLRSGVADVEFQDITSDHAQVDGTITLKTL